MNATASVPDNVKYPEKFNQITTDIKELRKVSYVVELGQPEEIAKCQTLAQQMSDILYIDRARGFERGNMIGYGLAARQLRCLDGQESPRLSVVIFAKAEDKYRANANKQVVDGIELWMLNPSIIRCNRIWRYKQEGCLSFPGLFYNTDRYLVATVGFVDLKTMAPREIEFYGTEAVVMQHEVDHHDGKLFTDHKIVPFTAAPKIGPNEPCPLCQAQGRAIKFKKCLEHQEEL